MTTFDWQPVNRYLEADCQQHRLFVGRVGELYYWSIRVMTNGSAWLPVKESQRWYDTPEQAQHECETAYRAEVARG